MQARALGICLIGSLLAQPAILGAGPPAARPELEELGRRAGADAASGATAPRGRPPGLPDEPQPPADRDGTTRAPAPAKRSVTSQPAPAATCREVPQPAPVKDDPLPTLTPLGRTETTLVDQFHDDYLYSPDGEFKIGTRREWGSTVVFFGRGGGEPGINASNTIDAYDTGRELQVALYDYDRAEQGCAWDASCMSQPETGCGNNITHLGWNPVQGGDECNRGSETDHVIKRPGRLEATLVPRFWNPDWEKKDCSNNFCDLPFELPNRSDVRYRQRLRFVDSHAVEIFMEYTNLTGLEHAPAFQEFPTLYSSFGKVGPDLWKVMNSEGERIEVDQPSNNGFFRRRFDSPGGWAALQNSALDYGVGLYYETRQRSYQAWQRRGEFNNFRARIKFGLPAWGKVRARAYLLIGSYATIRDTARRLDRAIGPFGGIDSPAPDSAVGPQPTITGWALDNWNVTEVELLLDGTSIATTTLTEARNDICTLWPGYEMCKQGVGFSVQADLSMASRCSHILEVRATDTDGNSRTIARQRVFVKDKAPPAPGAAHPIYRFRYADGKDRDTRFGRTDETPQGYLAEGRNFRLFSHPAGGRVPLWQRWCAACTDHLQTLDAEEGSPLYTGRELLGYCSKVETPQAPRELRRLVSAGASDHFVSPHPTEWQSAAASGYVEEGRCWIP